mmetsp:Transcript_73059/g.129045  ORF Transcript_73059/g.129045 Transcript_73059/m.129045 type:complete len:123 (-) Transcript_73059:62-430(-)
MIAQVSGWASAGNSASRTNVNADLANAPCSPLKVPRSLGANCVPSNKITRRCLAAKHTKWQVSQWERRYNSKDNKRRSIPACNDQVGKKLAIRSPIDRRDASQKTSISGTPRSIHGEAGMRD